MCRDAVSEMIWVYTDVTVWKYRPNEEFRCLFFLCVDRDWNGNSPFWYLVKCSIFFYRDVWQIYLERGEYGKARAITNKLSNPAPHQLVIKKEAEKYIAEKKYNFFITWVCIYI